MRVDNWPSRLADAVAAAERAPFVWGAHDCGSFAADCERAITGGTLFGDVLGGNYKTALGAARHLKRAGFENIEALVAARLPEVPVNFAQRGDWVVSDEDLGPVIGVMLGEVFVSPGDGGLVRQARAFARRAWRVG